MVPVQSSHGVVTIGGSLSLLDLNGASTRGQGSRASQLMLLTTTGADRRVVDGVKFVSSEKDEDFDVEEDQGGKGDDGGGKESEPHAVVRHIGGRPSVIGMPEKKGQ